MKSNNKIFYATKAVFDENTFLHCPEGTRASIPAIETGVLPLDEQNIPPEDDETPAGPPPPPPVERDTLWRPNAPRPNNGLDGSKRGPKQPHQPSYTTSLPDSKSSSNSSDMYMGDDKARTLPSRQASRNSFKSYDTTGLYSPSLDENQRENLRDQYRARLWYDYRDEYRNLSPEEHEH